MIAQLSSIKAISRMAVYLDVVYATTNERLSAMMPTVTALERLIWYERAVWACRM